jgi:hypothetical protein
MSVVQEARERKAEQMRAQKEAKKEKQRKAAERQARVGAALLQRDARRCNVTQPVATHGSAAAHAAARLPRSEWRAQSAVLTRPGAMA